MTEDEQTIRVWTSICRYGAFQVRKSMPWLRSQIQKANREGRLFRIERWMIVYNPWCGEGLQRLQGNREVVRLPTQGSREWGWRMESERAPASGWD